MRAIKEAFENKSMTKDRLKAICRLPEYCRTKKAIIINLDFINFNKFHKKSMFTSLCKDN